jgi:hypothetical protein
MQDISGDNRNARDAWNTNARFWDEHMGGDPDSTKTRTPFKAGGVCLPMT